MRQVVRRTSDIPSNRFELRAFVEVIDNYYDLDDLVRGFYAAVLEDNRFLCLNSVKILHERVREFKIFENAILKTIHDLI